MRLEADAAQLQSVRSALPEMIPTLRVRARRLARNDSIADDLVQDTVERALRFESSFRPGTNLRAWLQQILFSVFVTRCRRQRRERRALDSLTTDPCAWTHRDAGPEMQSLTPRVKGAIESLPAQFASVIRLVDIGELSYKDAAVTLGVPVGTVTSRLFRGRRLLASALRDEHQLAEAA
jgi:RNA polymerase sigma-70 factor (ECF subfamily)